ncbi:hypothetical protein [Vibrio fluvialis]|uniref:hypothetical protein n=1 Tax=Vibrio fluvialis TaxID=676 RepID=UPI001EEBE54A|nr:hypothetical protein [Vibrio fluvialis]MCG6391814.1 hypothetical protein [Vibrio fluvialis]
MNQFTNRTKDVQVQMRPYSPCVSVVVFAVARFFMPDSVCHTNKNGVHNVNAASKNQSSYLPAPTGDMKKCIYALNMAELNANSISYALNPSSHSIAKLNGNPITLTMQATQLSKVRTFKVLQEEKGGRMS